MVEVFKTNVQKKSQCRPLLDVLYQTFPSHKINFDLTDCDKILRVEGSQIQPASIICLVNEKGYECEELQ